MFQIEEQTFQDCIWPVLKARIKPLPELSLEMLHFVLVARAQYPHVVKKKFLLAHIGTTEIIHEDSVQACARLLMVGAVFHRMNCCFSYCLVSVFHLTFLQDNVIKVQ